MGDKTERQVWRRGGLRWLWRVMLAVGVAIALGLPLAATGASQPPLGDIVTQGIVTQGIVTQGMVTQGMVTQGIGQRLPELRAHPLPPALATLAPSPGGDYFDRLQASPVGPLVWSQFPIRLFLEPANAQPSSQAWLAAWQAAVADWSAYLPLQTVAQPDQAQIRVARSTPTLDLSGGTPRAANARTRYEFVLDPGPDGREILAFRMSIQMRDGRSTPQLRATARHELGHALGLWGHSGDPGDVLYDRPIAQPPTISARDLATLRRLYSEPTRVGWPLKS